MTGPRGGVPLLHGHGRTGHSMRGPATGYATLAPRPNDGKVGVAATRIAGMRDHIVLPLSRMLTVQDRRLRAQALAFPGDGAFSR